jgi:hypothetical protein
MPTDSEKLKPLLERGIQRTLPEQVQYAYLQALMHLESLLALVNDLHNDKPEDEDISLVLERLTNILAKNIRLKQKLMFGQQPNA